MSEQARFSFDADAKRKRITWHPSHCGLKLRPRGRDTATAPPNGATLTYGGGKRSVLSMARIWWRIGGGTRRLLDVERQSAQADAQWPYAQIRQISFSYLYGSFYLEIR